MMRHLLLVAIMVFGALLPAYPTDSKLQQLPGSSGASVSWTPVEIAKLISECGANTTLMTYRLYNYTFTAIDTDYIVDKQSGQIKGEESRGYEVYPIAIGKSARWIYVQIAANGAALSPDKIARERERAGREITELEQQASSAQTGHTTAFQPRFYSYGIRVEKRGGLSRTIWYINPTDFLVSHEFFAPQQVSYAGRDAIILKFQPRPGYVYDKTNVPYASGVEDYGRAMSQLGGRIWIDTADKVLVRLEAKPDRENHGPDTAGNTAPDAKAAVWFELTRLTNGTWAPSISRYNSYGREDVFWKTPISRSRKYSDYKLFKTTVEVEKTEASPVKPQIKTPGFTR